MVSRSAICDMKDKSENEVTEMAQKQEAAKNFKKFSQTPRAANSNRAKRCTTIYDGFQEQTL